MEQCRDRNTAAQHALFRRYVDGMMVVCLRYLENAEDAREAMMDGFLAFFTNLGGFTYRGAGSVQAWLRRIMVNECLMRLRKRGVLNGGWAQVDEEEPDGGASMDARLSAREIMQMIHGLPDGCRVVFNLYVFEDMGHAEIGRLLGITESTSKTQLRRARVLLKEKILQTS